MASKSEECAGAGFLLGGILGLGVGLVVSPFLLGFWWCVAFSVGLGLLASVAGGFLGAMVA